MSNMLRTIVPKSDQLNADDLIGQASLNINVTKVVVKEGSDEQPVSIYFAGDKGKPYKPSKSMRRVLVHGWGPDANQYVGRSMTLYRDPAVKWAGQPVGGLCISHMSHIEQPFTVALTATKGSRKPHTVNVLSGSQPEQTTEPPTVAEYEKCDGIGYKLLEARRKEHYSRLTKQQNSELEAAKKAAYDRLAAVAKAPSTAGSDDSTGKQAAPESAETDKLLQALKQPADADSLDASWSIVVDHFDHLGQEIPVAYRAAYELSKEQFQ